MTGPALSECTVARFQFFAGAESATQMVVTSGRNCGVIIRAAGMSRFDNVGIVARPTHGILSPRLGVGVTYKSAPGYKGEDSFVFTVTGKMRTGTGTATIKVRVSVT